MDRIPDRLGYITAIRSWNILRPNFVMSGNWLWTPRQPLHAWCSSLLHSAPGDECSCGIYAISHVTEQNKFHVHTDLVGEVALWGEVIVYEHGYRAEWAYPLSFGMGQTDGHPRLRVYEDLARSVAELYGVKYLEPEDIKELRLKYTTPPEPSECPLCKPLRHSLKDCPNPDKQAIIERAMKQIEYRKNYMANRRRNKRGW